MFELLCLSQLRLPAPRLFHLHNLVRTRHSVHVSNRWWVYDAFSDFEFVLLNGEKVCWVDVRSNRPIIWPIKGWLSFSETASHLSVMRVYCPLWTLEINDLLLRSMSVLLNCFVFGLFVWFCFGSEYRETFLSFFNLIDCRLQGML